MEKVYEIVAVGQEAKDLLETTAQINNELAHARKLRRQKSSLLSSDEKAMIDQVFASTDRAVGTVASLVEPARADMKVSGGHVRLSTHMQFVFRDQAHIPVSLSKLGIAGSNLNMAITVLCNKDGPRDSSSWRKPNSRDTHQPPTYRESEWLFALRRKNLQRRASATALHGKTGSSCHSLRSPPSSIAELPAESVYMNDEESISTVSDGIPIHQYLDADSNNTPSRTETPTLAPPEDRPPYLTGRARTRSWLEYKTQRW